MPQTTVIRAPAARVAAVRRRGRAGVFFVCSSGACWIEGSPGWMSSGIADFRLSGAVHRATWIASLARAAQDRHEISFARSTPGMSSFRS